MNVQMSRQKTPSKNFGQIPKRKCVCKIPHPPKVELELGEETTTSQFSKPNDFHNKWLQIPMHINEPEANRRYFKFTGCWTLHLENSVWSGHSWLNCNFVRVPSLPRKEQKCHKTFSRYDMCTFTGWSNCTPSNWNLQNPKFQQGRPCV